MFNRAGAKLFNTKLKDFVVTNVTFFATLKAKRRKNFVAMI